MFVNISYVMVECIPHIMNLPSLVVSVIFTLWFGFIGVPQIIHEVEGGPSGVNRTSQISCLISPVTIRCSKVYSSDLVP